MKLLKQRIESTLGEVTSYWRLYLTEGKGHIAVMGIQQVTGSLYRVRVEMALWSTFSFDALYIDGDKPCIFIDAYMLSHFTEFMIQDRTDGLESTVHVLQQKIGL